MKPGLSSLSTRILPLWLSLPLAFLGIALTILYPFGPNWPFYIVALLVAVWSGWWVRRRFVITVLERSDRSVVFRMERR
jgi:hypothetical protein